MNGRILPKTVYMCAPDYFRIPPHENPQCDPKRQPDQYKAQKQFRMIYGIYQRFGIVTHTITPHPYLKSMVFAANAGHGHITKNGTPEIVLSNYLQSTREDEKYEYRKQFEHLGATVFDPFHGAYGDSHAIFFEGQGDVLMTPYVHMMGCGIRTSRTAHSYVARLLALNNPVFSLKFVNEHFYHLDTCTLGPYTSDILVYYPGAFDYEALHQLSSADKMKHFYVGKRLAHAYVCNSVILGNVILLNIPFADYAQESFSKSANAETLSESDMRYKEMMEHNAEYSSLVKFLWDNEYDIIPVYTSEFYKSGAGVRCTSLFLF